MERSDKIRDGMKREGERDVMKEGGDEADKEKRESMGKFQRVGKREERRSLCLGHFSYK